MTLYGTERYYGLNYLIPSFLILYYCQVEQGLQPGGTILHKKYYRIVGVLYNAMYNYGEKGPLTKA